MVTLKSIVDMHQRGVDVFLGPENSCIYSAKLAAALNKPMIGFVCVVFVCVYINCMYAVWHIN